MTGKCKQSHGGIHSLETVLYHAAHGYRPGGAGAVAHLMGIDPGTFSKKLNEREKTHRLYVEDVRQIIDFTQDTRILDTVASAMGAVWFLVDDLPEFSGDLDLLKTSNDVLETAVGYVREFQDALQDGDIDADEKARLKKRRLKLVGAAYMLAELAKQYERDEEC